MKTIPEIILSHNKLDDIPLHLYLEIKDMIIEASQQAFEAGKETRSIYHIGMQPRKKEVFANFKSYLKKINSTK